MALYLITGIGGFIGSSLARALLSRGERVRGVDNFSTGNPENIKEIRGHIDFREADLGDLDAVQLAPMNCISCSRANPALAGDKTRTRGQRVRR